MSSITTLVFRVVSIINLFVLDFFSILGKYAAKIFHWRTLPIQQLEPMTVK